MFTHTDTGTTHLGQEAHSILQTNYFYFMSILGCLNTPT